MPPKDTACDGANSVAQAMTNDGNTWSSHLTNGSNGSHVQGISATPTKKVEGNQTKLYFMPIYVAFPFFKQFLWTIILHLIVCDLVNSSKSSRFLVSSFLSLIFSPWGPSVAQKSHLRSQKWWNKHGDESHGIFEIESVTKKNTNKSNKQHQQIIQNSTPRYFPNHSFPKKFPTKNSPGENFSICFHGASKGAANKQKAIHAKTKPKNLPKNAVRSIHRWIQVLRDGDESCFHTPGYGIVSNGWIYLDKPFGVWLLGQQR